VGWLNEAIAPSNVKALYRVRQSQFSFGFPHRVDENSPKELKINMKTRDRRVKDEKGLDRQTEPSV
jgi:hypothetical protein